MVAKATRIKVPKELHRGQCICGSTLAEGMKAWAVSAPNGLHAVGCQPGCAIMQAQQWEASGASSPRKNPNKKKSSKKKKSSSKKKSKSRKNPQGEPRILTTYEIVTPESAEHGDFAETGWIDEEGVSMSPDKYDIEDGVTAVDKAVKFLKDEGVEESSSYPFHKGAYYIGSVTQDRDYFEKGIEERHNFHLEGFTEEEERKIYRALFPTRKNPQHKARRGHARKNPEDRGFYVTTFCNFAHSTKTGRPIGHECYILDPVKLRQERDGTLDFSQSIVKQPRQMVRGRVARENPAGAWEGETVGDTSIVPDPTGGYRVYFGNKHVASYNTVRQAKAFLRRNRSRVRKNPEWAHTAGRVVRQGVDAARYAGNAAIDAYRGYQGKAY